jgi:hypothetical protein
MSASSNSGALPTDPVYDSERRLTLRGTVANVEWINPRVRFTVVVRDARTTTNWRVELADSATALERNGWNARSLKIGQASLVVDQAIRMRMARTDRPQTSTSTLNAESPNLRPPRRSSDRVAVLES